MASTLLVPSAVLVLFITTILGCTSVDAPESSVVDPTEESGSAAQVEESLTGVWKGASACRLSRWGFNSGGSELSPSRFFH
jgi:hypothetical protein